MRHIYVKSSWLQEKEAQQVLAYLKIKGEEHPADGLKKNVTQELAERYSKIVGMELGGDRCKDDPAAS